MPACAVSASKLGPVAVAGSLWCYHYDYCEVNQHDKHLFRKVEWSDDLGGGGVLPDDDDVRSCAEPLLPP